MLILSKLSQVLPPVSYMPSTANLDPILTISLSPETVPPRITQEGSKECSQHLGNTWSLLEPNEKEIFEKQMFFPGYDLAFEWAQPPTEHGIASLNLEAQEIYLPIFKKLVHMNMVAKDLGQAKCGPHLPTAR
ncbi:hypothetical protein DFH28DRAFT_1126795 [Melampsora americana]|nr:hypothetical protein DFH28DRAFT_1126795 [Melampsora americana]